MSAQERAKFLQVNEVHALQLVVCNCLSLGQFELARAIWLRLYNKSSSEALNISRRIVALGAPQSWLCSIAVPSGAHLSWLAATLERSVNAAAVGMPPWKRCQLELDILLTEVLLDGSSIGHQPLSSKVVETIRYHFFCSVRLKSEQQNSNDESSKCCDTIDTTDSTDDDASLFIHHFRERLPPFHVLPALSFLPPVKSYLPVRRARSNDLSRVIDTEFSATVLHQLRKLMACQPLLGRRLWSILVKQLSESPKHVQLLNVCVSLVSECFQHGNYKDGMWFLEGLSSGRVLSNFSSSSSSSSSSFSSTRPASSSSETTPTTPTPTPATNELDQKINSLFGQIVSTIKSSKQKRKGLDTSRIDNAAVERVRRMNQVYTSLLARPSHSKSSDFSMLHQYFQVEDKYVARQMKRENQVPETFIDFQQETKKENKSSSSSSSSSKQATKDAWSTFWGDYFTLMWIDKRHCLEYVLKKGLEFIHQRDFERAGTLVAPFPPLRALLFILSVDHPDVRDIEAKQQLIKVLWKRNHLEYDNKLTSLTSNLSFSSHPSELNIEAWCHQMEFVVDLTWWYTNHYFLIKSLDKVDPNKKNVWHAETTTATMTGFDDMDDDAGDAGDDAVGSSQANRDRKHRERVANAVLDAFEQVSVLCVMRESLPALDNICSTVEELSVIEREEEELERNNREQGKKKRQADLHWTRIKKRRSC